MRIKLNQDRAASLHELLKFLMANYKPENIAEKLIEDHMKVVYERLRKKVISDYTKDYSVTLTPMEAKAYYIFFNQNRIDLGSWQYESLMVQGHIHLIDKVYG